MTDAHRPIAFRLLLTPPIRLTRFKDNSPVNVLKYASRLDPVWVQRAMRNPVPWGPLGFVTYKRTYARLREDLGRTEEYGETVERCVNAILEYGGRFTHEEAYQLYEYVYTLKCSPPGRMFWQLGTSTVAKLGGASCCNCFYVSVNDIESFCFTFDMLMLGGGVGFGITPADVFGLPKVLGPVRVTRRDGNDVDFIVPDNREGWVELLRRTLHAYFITGRSFTYSTHCVRGKGERIKGFGGVASGPGELVKGIGQICSVLDARVGKKIRPVDALDIMNIIGSVVVSGNVRRSAQIAVGSPKDTDYMEAKMWSKGNIPNWRGNSNNTVRADDMSELTQQFWDGYLPDEHGNAKGENYGLFNLELSRTHGRLVDGPNYRTDPRAEGPNPCQPGFATVLTPQGIRTFDDIDIGSVIWSGKQWTTVVNKWATGVKPVFRYTTTAGEFVGTENHRIVQNGVKIEVGEADAIDSSKCVTASAEPVDPQDVIDGWVLGDGSVHKASNGLVHLFVGDDDGCIHLSEVAGMLTKHRPGLHPKAWEVKTTIDACELPLTYERSIPKRFVQGDTRKVRGFLRGLYAANGSVCGGRVTLKATSFGLVKQVQQMLSSIGIASYHTTNKAKTVKFDNGDYECRESYDLNITTDRTKFALLVGFIHPTKQVRLNSALEIGKATKNGKHTFDIVGEQYIGDMPVYDITVDAEEHTYWTGGCLVSNCAEQTLEDGECCDLAELYLPNLRDRGEFVTAARHMYKVCKTVLQLPFSWAKTQSVVTRNQRMGVGVSGFCQAQHFGAGDYTAAYRSMEELDVEYSREIKANQSIKLSTVKPSGSVSLLAGVTPGVHPAFSRYYIRRMRFSADDPIVATCRKSGYHVEPKIEFDGTADHSTQIVSFPIDVGENTLTANKVSAVQQMDMQEFLQTYWSDNAVSVTVYYRDEELPAVQERLREGYRTRTKTISFLRHSNHGFKQAPYEEITAEQYREMASQSVPVTSLSDAQQWDIVDSLECAGNNCPVK